MRLKAIPTRQSAHMRRTVAWTKARQAAAPWRSFTWKRPEHRTTSYAGVVGPIKMSRCSNATPGWRRRAAATIAAERSLPL